MDIRDKDPGPSDKEKILVHVHDGVTGSGQQKKFQLSHRTSFSRFKETLYQVRTVGPGRCGRALPLLKVVGDGQRLPSPSLRIFGII